VDADPVAVVGDLAGLGLDAAEADRAWPLPSSWPR
jgi:hypothetical protein